MSKLTVFFNTFATGMGYVVSVLVLLFCAGFAWGMLDTLMCKHLIRKLNKQAEKENSASLQRFITACASQGLVLRGTSISAMWKHEWSTRNE